jgi:hypothetical protein
MQPETPGKPPINMLSEAYLKGCSAGLADNYCDIKNPYDIETIENKEWSAGWHWGVSNWDMNMNDGG